MPDGGAKVAGIVQVTIHFATLLLAFCLIPVHFPQKMI